MGLGLARALISGAEVPLLGFGPMQGGSAFPQPLRLGGGWGSRSTLMVCATEEASGPSVQHRAGA